MKLRIARVGAGIGILLMAKGSKIAPITAPRAQDLNQSLKLLFMLLSSSYAVAVAVRLVALPVPDRDQSFVFLLPSMLAVPAIMISWLRLTHPGIRWQIGLTLLGLAGVAVTAIQGGAFTLWILPLASVLCALLIALVGLKETSTKSRIWGLTSRQWMLTALFVCAMVGIGLLVWSSHQGAAREANVLFRSVRVSLLILFAWSVAISLCLSKVSVEQANKLFFVILLAAILLSNFALLSLISFTNQFSSSIVPLSIQMTAVPILAILSSIGLIFPHWANRIALTGFLVAVWIHGSILSPTNSVDLTLAGLSGMFITAHRWPLACAYWAAVLLGSLVGVGHASPALITNAMAATIIFGGSYRLSRILKAYSEHCEAEVIEVREKVQPIEFSHGVDRSSALTGVAVAAGVALIGGVLLYVSYSREHELTQKRSQTVAERLADTISSRLQNSERLAQMLAIFPSEMRSNQGAFEKQTNPVVSLVPGNVLQWAPKAVIKFINPLKGNEKAVGLDLLSVPEQQVGVSHVIATGEAAWNGPFALAQGGQALIYRVPVYKAGAKASQASFIGLAQAVVKLDDLIEDKMQFDQEGYDLSIWLTNTSIQNGLARPRLVWSSSLPGEGHIDLAGVAQTSGIQADNHAKNIAVRVEARPRKVEALETLPARLQGLLIIAFLAGIGAAVFERNRGRTQGAQKLLRESEEKFRGLFEEAPDAFLLMDSADHARIIDCNKAAERMLRGSREQIIGKTPADLSPLFQPDGRLSSNVADIVQRALEENIDFEWLHQRLDGEQFWAQVTTSIMPHSNPAVLIVAWRDLTERKEAESSLREQETQFRKLFFGSTAALILVDKSGRIRMANHEACSVFEYADEDMIGMNVDQLVPEALRAGHKALRDGYFKQGLPTRLGSERDLQAVAKDGRLLDFELGLTRLVIGDEELVLASIIDVTHRKRAELARSQFIANISHELRTPLNAVLGYANLLKRAPLEGEHKERLQRLNQAGAMLFGLVNDVLDWSKIEAGEIDLGHEAFSLLGVCENLSSVMRGQAHEKGLKFSYHKRPEVPDFVIGDAMRFQQIMFNLIGNAIKFTQRGEILLEIDVLPCGNPDKVRLKFEVSDTGVGIPKQDQQYLFERFRQVDQSATRRFQGTGLGLAIVKELAELMGGSVRVQSEPGVGSTFTVELEFGVGDDAPLALDGQQQQATGQPERPLAGKRVLLVDDSDVIVELAEVMLEIAGAQVTSLSNGKEAVDWLGENPGKVDIVLMDVHMPVMDGNTAVALLRRDPNFQDLPVIAMTAGATRTGIDEALSAGMTDCITKPFSEQQIIAAVLKHSVV